MIFSFGKGIMCPLQPCVYSKMILEQELPAYMQSNTVYHTIPIYNSLPKTKS